MVFWLLTFFIISSLFLTNPEGLPVNLPKATSSQPTQTTNRVTITIDSKGQVSLDRQPTTVEALPAQQTALAATGQYLIAAINSDESVDFGLAVAVMDRVRQVKGVEYPIVIPSIEVPHSWVPTTFLASKDAGECVRQRGAFTLIRNSWGRRCCQEREDSVWWPAVVGAINFDGLIVLDIAIEPLAVAIAGGDKAHLANGRNSNLKCRCEQSNPGSLSLR